MSDAATPAHPKTHNQPPVVLPNEQEMLTDLQRKYPEIDDRLKEWDGAFAEFPLDIPLDQEDVAQNLQDLLGQVKKDSKIWTDSFQKQEKKPLNALVKVVGNFFTSRVERAEKHLEKFGPVHEGFLQRKAEASRKAAEAEAERQREIERQAREAAERAAQEQAAAEARAAEERRREEEARAAAERAAQERAAAEARAAEARERERRENEERRVRDTAEKDQNLANLREIREGMKEAEKLHTLAEADEASEDEVKRLAELIRPGGIIGELARPVAASMLLTEEQKERTDAVRKRMGELRDASEARGTKKQRAAAEKARREEDTRLAAEAETRRIAREADERRAAEARASREADEAAAQTAAEERRRQEAAAREARDAARDAEGEAKAAGKDAKGHTTEADRTANRATRIETNLEKSTDADHSRTRGELGTVGGLARRWAYHIVDEAALRAGFLVPGHLAPSASLAEHLTTDALEGAVFRWMRAHQGSFTGERIEGLLPGVVFAYEQEARIV